MGEEARQVHACHAAAAPDPADESAAATDPAESELRRPPAGRQRPTGKAPALDLDAVWWSEFDI
jgi:hypothetical protein